MLAKVKTSTISGLDALPVEVEVQARKGLPSFTIIGLGDGAVRESRDRVMTAIRHSGFKIPERVLVNLAPAELKKEGSAFDLPIALAILLASGQVGFNAEQAQISFHGELALDGTLKPVRGAVALAIRALKSGVKELVLPRANLQEARLVAGISVYGLSSLAEVIQFIREGELPSDHDDCSVSIKSLQSTPNLSGVWGQLAAKRALSIAAAGSHNLLMIGPPGCGKSMLAQRFPSILPELSEEEMLEVVGIHSIAGQPIVEYLNGTRPYRAPHHLISEAGLIGGGSVPRPGEISLAHRGVLFLDEFPEFRRAALEALRAPLESGVVQVARAKASIKFPASIQLIAAMNPCPCGRLGSQQGKCRCSMAEVATYLRKLSQPILDRIDLHVELEAVPLGVITTRMQESFEDQSVLYQRVQAARLLALKRSAKPNALLTNEELTGVLALTKPAYKLLEKVSERSDLSVRGYMRVLRVARTISDLEQQEQVTEEHLAEALGFRSLERLHKYCNAA